MPKTKSALQASSTPQGKRRKVENQPSIHHFFSSFSSGQARGSSQADGKEAESTPGAVQEKSFNESHGVDDRKFAEMIAKRDGIDLDTSRRMEIQWKESISKRETSRIDIIDVDLLDEGDDCSALHWASTSIEASEHPSPPSLHPGHSGPSKDTIVNTPLSMAVSPVYKALSVDPSSFLCDEKCWPEGSPAPYSFLAHTLRTLSDTRSRIVILDTLTNTLRILSRHDPLSLLPALYLLSNTISPPYLANELGLGPSIVTKAIQQVSGLSSAALKRLYNTTGDAGDVAFEAKSNLRTLIPHPSLRIGTVYDSLIKIAGAKGLGATKQKREIIEQLLVAAKGEETRFLVRTLSQNLRVGAVRTSLLIALARAMVLTPPSTLRIPVAPESPYYSAIAHDPRIYPADSKHRAADPLRDKLNTQLSEAESLVKQVYVRHPNYDDIVAALLETGLDGLAERVPLTVGIPVHPTLGSPSRSLEEIYDRLGDLPFTAELKYDGQRAQVHGLRCADGKISVRIFSRHLEDMTSRYPDITRMVEWFFEYSPETESFIIDSEIVAIDPVDGNLKSFQQLSSRARKDVQVHEVTVTVCVFAFDLMYLDGQILLGQAFRNRRSLLRARFRPFVPLKRGIARLDHVESCESEDGRKAVESFWEKAVQSRCEGLMIKLLDNGEDLKQESAKKINRRKGLPATYEPDKRTSAWLKLKKDYVEGLGDSLDLVPIGAWHGNGRKAQWWSPILLALRDPTSGQFVAVCKCMSGFSDMFYKALGERYTEDSETCSNQSLWDCDTGGFQPEVYFKPQEVWEIHGADVTLSPVSVAALGLVSQLRGLSLRFPRFIKVRDDKAVEEASSPGLLASMWRSQQGPKAGDCELSNDDKEEES